MSDLISAVFLVAGGFFAMVAGLGLVRFPDLASRMHAATKASGAALLLALIAVCVRLPGWDVLIKSLVTLGFGFLTLPVAAHLLGRSAIIEGRPERNPEPDAAALEPEDGVEAHAQGAGENGEKQMDNNR